MHILILIGFAAISISSTMAYGQHYVPSKTDRDKQAAQKKAERDAALPKMQAALKEIAGVTLGQPISDAIPRGERGEKMAMQKPYRYFTKISSVYEFDKLVGVRLYFETDGKYSVKSLEAEMDATKKDVAERLGINPESNVRRLGNNRLFGRGGLTRSIWANGWSVDISYSSMSKEMVLSICDMTLSEDLRKADREAKEAKLEALPVFTPGNSVNKTREKESRAKDDASIEAERKATAEVDAKLGEERRDSEREIERQTQREQLRAISEELRRAREEAKVKKMIESGDTSYAIELRDSYKAMAAKSKKELDRLLSMKGKTDSLSSDALAIYNKKVNEKRKLYDGATNALARIEAMLTPDKLAELAEEKARKDKAEDEFNAFMNGSGK